MCCIVLKIPYLCVVNGKPVDPERRGKQGDKSIAMNLLKCLANEYR